MAHLRIRNAFREAFSEYGMVLVLVFMVALFSVLTISKEEPAGATAARALFQQINDFGSGQQVLVVASPSLDDATMAEELKELLQNSGHLLVQTIQGDPPAIGRALQTIDGNPVITLIATTQSTARWPVVENAPTKIESLNQARVIYPESQRRSRFLQADNMRNIADRISVIAILAIGMTLVIITAGIDLSVGSFIALAAVTCALFIQEFGGGAQASPGSLIFCSLGAMAICGLLGLFSGVLSTTFNITPFIVTLAMMMIARGLAYKFSNVTTIPITNESFAWLGKGRMAGVPVSVLLMALLYAAAYFVMHWTTFGRRIYAIGGNTEAARLSGVPVKKVLVWVYAISGLLAGLGGVVTASNLAGGAATYGDYYELYTIAAVVVGGTSLMGGQGKIIGTLIGAFIIAVIQSGMNQVGIESNTQKVVFGMVIIGAIVIDKYKRREIAVRHLGLLLVSTLVAGAAIFLLLRHIYPGNF